MTTGFYWWTLSARAARHLGPFLSTWISNYTHYKVWDEITYPFPNFNEVWEWMSNFIPHFIIDVITYPYCDLSQSMLAKVSLDVLKTKIQWHTWHQLLESPPDHDDKSVYVYVLHCSQLTHCDLVRSASSLVQVMVYHLFDIKRTLNWIKDDHSAIRTPRRQNNFHTGNCIWDKCLQNVHQFVYTLMC